MRLKTGTYTGNGTDNRAFTGLGFQPNFIWIKPKDTSANDGAMSWSAIGSDKSFDPNASATPAADMIQSFDSDGFTIGTAANVNTNGVDYVWVAIYGGTTDIVMSSYVGTGVNPNIVTGVGFQPDLIIIKRNGGSNAQWIWRFGGLRYTWVSTNGASGLVTVDADGFTVTTTSSTLNTLGVTYLYLAMRYPPSQAVGASYTGDATNGKAITGLGFAPQLVWIKATSTNRSPVFRTADGHTSTNATVWLPSVADISDGINSLDSDGFSLGVNVFTNAVASYRYFAMRDSNIAQTKSLTYHIKIPTAVTKSLTYRIKKGIPVTKQLKYTVKSAHAVTKSLTYRVKKSASVTKSLAYKIKKGIAQTKSLTYKVKKNHSVTKSLTYVILQAAVEVVITKSLSYKIKKTRVQTLSLTYVVAYTPPGYSKQIVTLTTNNDKETVLQLQSRITVLQSKQRDRITLI